MMNHPHNLAHEYTANPAYPVNAATEAKENRNVDAPRKLQECEHGRQIQRNNDRFAHKENGAIVMFVLPPTE
jgi:hypothetical protein